MPRWTPALATGRPDIDGQHQELFRRAEAVDQALAEGRSAGQTAQETLRFLADYCEKHFATEQSIMYRGKYPAMADHLAEHAWFTNRFRELQRHLASGGSSEEAVMQLDELLLSWFVKHIGTADKALVSFLRDNPWLRAGVGWNPSLTMGVPEIDAQHQAIFEQVARFEATATGRGSPSTLQELFEFLSEHVKGHLEAEERLMEESGYPGIDEQRQQHAEFTRRLKLLVPLWDAEGESHVVCHVMLGFVQSWLANHVLSSDRRLGDYLARRNAIAL
jgi:hemerythrin